MNEVPSVTSKWVLMGSQTDNIMTKLFLKQEWLFWCFYNLIRIVLKKFSKARERPFMVTSINKFIYVFAIFHRYFL